MGSRGVAILQELVLETGSLNSVFWNGLCPPISNPPASSWSSLVTSPLGNDGSREDVRAGVLLLFGRLGLYDADVGVSLGSDGAHGGGQG